MNAVEPAASLFADEDAASDPFASLGADPTPNDGSAANQQHAENASVPFMNSTTTDFPVGVDTARANPSPYAISQTSNTAFDQPAYPVNDWNTSDQFSVTQHDHYDHSSTQAYDPYAPVSSQAGNVQHIQNTAYSQASYSNHTNYSYTSSYSQPVNSQSDYSQGLAYSQPYTQQTSTYAQPSYDPYAPTQTSVAYTNNLNVETKSPYSAYTPQQATSTSQYAPYPASSAGSTASVSAPPKPTSPPSKVQATLNRPKMPNAYDPPFPTMSSNRRNAPVRATSGAASYGGYQPQLQPTPPPQSLPPSSTQSSTTYPPAYSYPNTLSGSQPSIPQNIGSQGTTYASSYSEPSHPAAQYEPRAYTPPHMGVPRETLPSTANVATPEYMKPPTPVEDIMPTTNIEEPSTDPSSSTTSVQASELHSSVPAFTSGISSIASPPKDTDARRDSVDSQMKRPYSRGSSIIDHHQQPVDRYPANVSPSPRLNGVLSPDISKKGPLYTQLPPSRTSSPQAMFDPYAPRGSKVANVYGVERTASPSSASVKSSNGRQSVKPYQAGPPKAAGVESTPVRSLSNGSLYSLPAEDSGKALLREPERAHPSPYSWSGYEPSVTQEITVKPLPTAYAPSPSLIAANDPLGRTSARAPVVSFGFGGKLVACFHSAGSVNTGFDVALSARNSTAITVRVLKDVIPDSALDVSTSYPGPLVSDPGPATAGIVRPGAATQIKNKKSSIVKYLDERCDELSRGLGYLSAGSEERRAASGKLTLMKFLKIMIENDGRLTGSSQIDSAVRTALVPRLDGDLLDPNSNAVPAYTLADNKDAAYLNESPLSVTTVRPSVLVKIQDFLLHGERKKAYHYALDEKLWAHAMIIASSIDKDAWKEVVNEFLKTELGAKDDSDAALRPNGGDNSVSSSRYESLRVAYSLFSGQGAAAVQELVPQNVLNRPNPNGALLQPAVPISQVTPRTPNFVSSSSVPIPPESLSSWAETVAMIISSPLSLEGSATLTALGDQLFANQWVEAAHACYLLSPQTSSWGGAGNSAARIVLVGSQNPSVHPGFGKDEDSLILSEIAEFALSLIPVPKGQESFTGLPHLQAYRFIRAAGLAELGYMQLAGRYCEAITASMNRGSPYFTPPLLEQLKGLADRINGVSHGDRSGSWMGGKISKPSLDTIGGWFENRFTKLVTGDVDTPTESQPDGRKHEDPSFAGPFSHYSTISLTPSARSSPQPTTMNVNVLPPYRSGSAMSMSAYTPPQVDKTPYGADYSKQRSSPGPYTSSGLAHTPYQPPAPTRDTTQVGHGVDRYSNEELTTPKTSNDDRESDNHVQEIGWWGSTSYADTSNTRTPTTATFMQVDPSAIGSSSDGFISLMDTQLSIATPTMNDSAATNTYTDDEDDLGLGNSKPKPMSVTQAADQTAEQSAKPASAPTPAAKPAAPERPDIKPAPASSGSWLSRWWKRDASTPGPIKASLGEESTFYYDPEQKRWVNKKAGAEEANKPAIPPPPPSRAQTASPGMTGPRAAPPAAANSMRSASAIDLTTSPPSKPAMRVRSNLVPPPESAPSTPTGTRLTVQGPPPGRPRSQASTKRNARSRYVDVFAHENTGA